MKSIIICEGYTDCILLQYFLRKAYEWEDGGRDQHLESTFKTMRVLKKAKDIVKIGGCGGCTEILSKLSFVLEMNHISADNEPEFAQIVVITDRDEQHTEQDFINDMTAVLAEKNIRSEQIKNDQWCEGTYYNGRGKELSVKLLLLVIPFSGTGALETFLLDAISADNAYDAGIISSCRRFVDHIDPAKKYLSQRRYVTKAKFNVYFSVRTAEEQFVERQNVLMHVDWERYGEIQKGFQKLRELSEEAKCAAIV